MTACEDFECLSSHGLQKADHDAGEHVVGRLQDFEKPLEIDLLDNC